MLHPQQTAAPATTAQPTKAELKEQIKQTIQAAQEAAREASQIDAGRGGPVIAVPPVPPVPPFGGGFTAQPNQYGAGGIPQQVVDISIGFFLMCAVMVIGWPIARAFGKRLERRPDVTPLGAGTTEQLQRIEQAVDAMAIEIERISESQRFMARLQNSQTPERAALPADQR